MPKQIAEILNVRIAKTAKVHYLLFLPEGYDARSSELWPMILFLHGAGERGNDPWKVKVHGPPKIAEKMSNFPFIVVSPQCPNGQWWSNQMLAALLEEIQARYPVDSDRIYLSGLSMGGF